MNNGTGLKIKKQHVINILIAAGYAVLILSLILGTTGARYAETRNVYTNFDAASFNAVILGDLGDSYSAAKTKLYNGDTYAFSDTFNSVDFHPGETRNLDFTIANGDYAINASDVGTQYSIKLRTTGNIPVDFYLTYTYEASDKQPVTKNYRPGSPTTISTGIEGDSSWYEYSFYEVLSKDPVSGDETLAKSQAAFSLPGGNTLDLNMHSFVISWPEPTETVTEAKATNDASYMKELRVFEVFVSVHSLNSEEEKTAISSSEIPALPADQFYTTGIIYMIDGNNFKLEQVQTRHYPIDYRAFYNTTDSESVIDGAVFGLILNDGITTNSSPTQAELDATPYQTDYKLKLMVPVGYEGETYEQSKTDNKYNNAGYIYKLKITDTNGDTLLEKLSSKYYLYSVQMNSYSAMSEDIDTDEKALAYYDDPENEINKNEIYIYRLDTFKSIGQLSEYMKTNTNERLSSMTGRPNEIVGHRDEITVMIFDKDGNAVTLSDIPGSFAVTHKLDLQLEYMYTNSRLPEPIT